MREIEQLISLGNRVQMRLLEARIYGSKVANFIFKLNDSTLECLNFGGFNSGQVIQAGLQFFVAQQQILVNFQQFLNLVG